MMTTRCWTVIDQVTQIITVKMASSILDLPFKMLSILGIWKSNLKSGDVTRGKFDRFRLYVTCFVLCFYLTLSSGALITAKDTSEFSEIFSTMATGLLTCFKILNIIIRSKDIRRLRRIIESNDLCLPENETEKSIISKMVHLIK